MKNITILGSTGSIGEQTLDIIRNNKDRFKVRAVAANTNAKRTEEQIREFEPELAVLYDGDAAASLRESIKDTSCRVLSGMDGLKEAVHLEKTDIVVGAMVGMIGIEPTIEAIKAGCDIALANKETLVCAGHIIMDLAKENKVKIIPVDSEHSAIYQSLRGGQDGELEKILLTASGGPFFGKSRQELEKITVKEALKHPNWDMGVKVTIDSASLVNKGLEVMEAHWLFDVDIDDIEVVVHPQSIIHSMVQFKDGAVIAQLGLPDMHLPIQYALTEPSRIELPGKRLDFFELGKLTFFKPDTETFKGLALAMKAAKKGGLVPTVFNAANEIAVRAFAEEKTGFLQIPELIEDAMENVKVPSGTGIDDIMDARDAVSLYLKGKIS
ncbi:MAG: 1-deoxy-D-xylulose-5-phosphate reductoisomerase [Lachnospiraceae bacterium]|nr:1-deoxy-D-xylulose-5-phosphate reductoisomerase [Lachnospiraceae bacterium]